MIILKDWYKIEIEEVIEAFDSNLKGLDEKEALSRLEKEGKNILPKGKKDTLLKVFLSQFNNPIIFILIITTVLSLFIGEIIDSIFIGAVILLDAVLGTVQEWKAEKNAELLQNLIKIKTNVLRDGKETVIDAEDLVIGDIVLLDSGDKIPADIRIIESNNLSVNEAILTGESIAAEKDEAIIKEDTQILERKNMLFAGTTVTRGRATGIVVATSIDTEIGSITNQVLLTETSKAPITIRMEHFTKQISIFTAIIAIMIGVILYYKGYLMREIFFSIVALSVSAIPEGLPIALTLALSIGSNRMAKKNVLVKKLNSVESLGSCTIIASDKTGTLTLNEQTAKKIWLTNGISYDITGIGYNDEGNVLYKEKEVNIKNIEDIIKLGVINNEATLFKDKNRWVHFGDSIDVAFLSLGKKVGIKKDNYKKDIFGVIPYESSQKYSAVFYEEDGLWCSVKGSLEKLMEFSDTMYVNGKVEKIDKGYIEKQNEFLAKNGYRVIALAKGKIKEKKEEDYKQKDIPKLTIVGLVGFIDPIREETVFAIKECTKANIKTVMITGDHPLTAFHIGKELNMVNDYSEVSTGLDIDKALEEGHVYFDNFVKGKKIFARVSPSQKYEIVESYKRQGEFIAVTGDGVNDALAIKSANIGIAMGSGSDIAKETSQMIITDDNFASIVTGIREGRNAYNNVRKVIYMLLSSGIAEVLFFMLSILLGLPLPLVAIQLLWLNLVTDGIQDAALAFEKGEPDVMDHPPRKPNEKIFNELLIKEVLLSGLFSGLIVFLFFKYLLNKGTDLNLARSYVMILMVFMQNIHTINCRSETRSVFKIPLRDNKFVVYAILGVLTLQFIVTNTPVLSHMLKLEPIPLTNIFIVFLLALPILFIMEIFKIYIRRRNRV